MSWWQTPTPIARMLPRLYVPPTSSVGGHPYPDEGIDWIAETPMAPQIYAWTCSACALDWVLRATGLNPNITREQAVEQIGYPDNINATYGLMDANGSALRDVYDSYGQPTDQAWLDFDSVYQLVQHTTGQMSGTKWYHWVALRGVQGDAIWIANSAPGYMGVWDTLTRADFNRLGGFSVVWLSSES